MVDSKCKIVLALTLVLIVAFVVPVLAVNYSPGVSVGQYVKYGNFSVTVNGSETGSPLDWTKVDVTAVSGKEVSLRTSGQFKNGSATPGSGSISVYNIETGKLNGTTDYTYGPIIAGNLSEGDAIPPLSYGFVVNKTEIRTYSGVNRTVNIIDTTYSDPNYGNHWTLVYDKVSGIMLESGVEYTQKVPAQTTTRASYSVVETNIYAVPGASGWSKTYGGTGYDIGTGDTVQTSDGGYAVSGDTNSSGAGGLDFWLFKTDAAGNMIWNKTYGGALEEVTGDMVQSSDGGYAISGYTTSFGAGGRDAWLVKTDANGNMQWNKTYGGTGDEYGHYLVQTSDGGYAFAGYTNSSGAGSLDIYLVKTDAAGNMQWSKTYGANGTDFGYGVVQTSDGGYALTGSTNSFGVGSNDTWLVKTDASGNMQWNKTYGGTGNDISCDMMKTSDGGFLLTGYSTSFGGYRAYVIKTDAAGSMQWNKTYGGTIEVGIHGIQTEDGGYAVAGWNYQNGQDFMLIKTDAAGNMLWKNTYGGTGLENAYAVVQTNDKGYALTGATTSFGAGGYDFWLVKVDASGVIPEGLTLGVIMLLSSIAAVAGALYFRKPPRIAK